MALNLPDNPAPCDVMSQKYGALTGDGMYCWPVTGKEVQIKDGEHSIMEGFEVTNFNFHCSGVKPAVENSTLLPGSVQSSKKDMWV